MLIYHLKGKSVFQLCCSDQQLLQNSLKTFCRVMLPIGNAPDNITLLRKLQFNPQRPKCLNRDVLSITIYFVVSSYVHSNTSSGKRCLNKLEVVIRNVLVEIKNVISYCSF